MSARTLAPVRIRAIPYGGRFYDWRATCRICGDWCSNAADDGREDWLDSLAWAYGHMQVRHPGWRRPLRLVLPSFDPGPSWKRNRLWVTP